MGETCSDRHLRWRRHCCWRGPPWRRGPRTTPAPRPFTPNSGPRRTARPRSPTLRSEEHTSELQSLMRISYAVFCLKKKKNSRIGTLHKIDKANVQTPATTEHKVTQPRLKTQYNTTQTQ